MTDILCRAQPTPFEPARLLVFALAAATASVGSHWVSSGSVGGLLILGAIAIAMWHGAFDGVLAEAPLRPRWGPRWRPLFFVAYLAAAALVLLLWWLVPTLSLTVFLIISALHFGTECERHLSPSRLLTGVALGGIPIAAACRWSSVQVAAIIQGMLRNAGHATMITVIAGHLLWPLVAVALLYACVQRDQRIKIPVLVSAELVLFRCCSPAVAFAVFFCLWHTPEHMVGTSLDRAGRFQPGLLFLHLRQGFKPWLLSVSALLLFCCWGRHTITAYLGTLFVVLSCLTVPHMMLAEAIRRTDVCAVDRPWMRSLSPVLETHG